METIAEVLSESSLCGAIGMILALFGTNPYPFDRLIEALDKYSKETGVKIIVQSGNTPPLGETLECHSFVNHSTLAKWIAEAEVVVSQGGFGSLADCIAQGARTVAVPRDNALGESVDDQKELVNALADEGLVEPVYDISDLPKAVNRVRGLERKPVLQSGMPDHVAKTIEKMIFER